MSAMTAKFSEGLKILLLIVLVGASALLWLFVSSNLANVLHYVAKTQISMTALGTVNLMLLGIAVLWSLAAFLVVLWLREIDIGLTPILTFGLWLFALTALVSGTAYSADAVLGKCIFLGPILWFVEIGAAAYLAQKIFFHSVERKVFQNILAEIVVGLSGILTITSLILFIMPGLHFRWSF